MDRVALCALWQKSGRSSPVTRNCALVTLYAEGAQSILRSPTTKTWETGAEIIITVMFSPNFFATNQVCLSALRSKHFSSAKSQYHRRGRRNETKCMLISYTGAVGGRRSVSHSATGVRSITCSEMSPAVSCRHLLAWSGRGTPSV
jgi:hypothetical protein